MNRPQVSISVSVAGVRMDITPEAAAQIGKAIAEGNSLMDLPYETYCALKDVRDLFINASFSAAELQEKL